MATRVNICRLNLFTSVTRDSQKGKYPLEMLRLIA